MGQRRTPRALARASTIDVLGAFSRLASRPDVEAELDWKLLAEKHLASYSATHRLSREHRARCMDAERARREDPSIERAPLRFEVPKEAAPPGPYYLVNTLGARRASIARVVGEIYVDLDERECELGPRTYHGHFVLARSDDGGPGGFLVRGRSGDVRIHVQRVGAKMVGGSVEVSIPTQGGSVTRVRVPPRGDIVGAGLVTVEPGSERLLLLHTQVPANCETQVELFGLARGAPDLIAEAALDCDV